MGVQGSAVKATEQLARGASDVRVGGSAIVARRATIGGAAEVVAATVPATAQRNRRRKHRRPREELASYLVRVRVWDYHYSFRATDPTSRWESGAYAELPLVSFTGEIIRPEGTTFKHAKVTFSGRAGMMEEEHSSATRSIGSLTAAGDELNAYIFTPVERIGELTAVALSGRIKIVNFVANRLRHRSALIVSTSVHTQFNPSEW